MNKQTLSNIIIALGIIIVVILGIWLFAYLPNVGSTISTKNDDWGYFGEFFWGLGTMLLTGLSVWVLYKVNESLNEFNENLQRKQQEFELNLAKDRQKFEIELEERRGEIQSRNLQLKRMDYWQNEYHEIVLKLVQGGVSTDEEWLNVLRRTTLLYKSMQSEHYLDTLQNGQELSNRMDQIEVAIFAVINETYHATGLKTKKMKYWAENTYLNMLVVGLYFDLFKLKGELQESNIDQLVTGKVETEQNSNKIQNIMKNYLDFFNIKPQKTINDLRNTVETYMRCVVDGDTFKNEQEFEDAVRKMLKSTGFTVLEKRNVANTIAIVEEKHFSDVDAQIPDLAVLCIEGLVLIEMKLRRESAAYKADVNKISQYVGEGKCVATGALFLDDEYHTGWKRCLVNSKYFYYWNL